MSSPHIPLPKPSRVAKISVRPIWRKKLNHCNSSNEVDVNLPTPMLKPQSPINEPTTHSNHVSLHSHSLLLIDSCDTNVGQASIPPQSINQSQTQPLFPHLLINSHVAKGLADPTLQVPLDEIRVDDKLNFVEEPMEMLEREIKKLKRSRIAIIKVQ
ncbi:hypothetical protein Tco_0438285 [Tanacetum coccineum]